MFKKNVSALIVVSTFVLLSACGGSSDSSTASTVSSPVNSTTTVPSTTVLTPLPTAQPQSAQNNTASSPIIGTTSSSNSVVLAPTSQQMPVASNVSPPALDWPISLIVSRGLRLNLPLDSKLINGQAFVGPDGGSTTFWHGPAVRQQEVISWTMVDGHWNYRLSIVTGASGTSNSVTECIPNSLLMLPYYAKIGDTFEVSQECKTTQRQISGVDSVRTFSSSFGWRVVASEQAGTVLVCTNSICYSGDQSGNIESKIVVAP